ncbi:MAG TPA: type II secretion system protein GspL [Sphingobium sp.]|nr:type II secretion system protein GspL [Sphingobium sp.]
MSVREGLIVILSEQGEPLWMRIVEDAVVQSGAGSNWLAACGLTALPDDALVMLVPPAPLVTLHWIAHPDLPPRQARAAARLSAIAAGIVPADQLFAAADENDDPARPHIVAVAARSDMQHWLLWAQHHGLDPDLIVPAALLIPAPMEGFNRATVGNDPVLRGRDVALAADLALPELLGDAAIHHVPAERVAAVAVAALAAPPVDLRQGDFAKRVRRTLDGRQLTRIMLWSGLILLASLLIALVGITRQHVAASSLDAESLALARQVLPSARDVVQAEAEMDRQLAARGAGAYAFTAPVAGLLGAMQDAPGVSLTALSRDPDGMIRATLAAAKADEINGVLLALQGAGFTITATSSQAPSGQTLADITVRA